MTTSKKTYKLSDSFPAYTVSQWNDVYNGFVRTFYSTPKESKKGKIWESFMELVNKVKAFLKKHGVKFI